MNDYYKLLNLVVTLINGIYFVLLFYVAERKIITVVGIDYNLINRIFNFPKHFIFQHIFVC